MSTSFSHNFDRFVFLMRMIFLYYLDQESHALMTDLEKCLDQEVEKKSSTRDIIKENSCRKVIVQKLGKLKTNVKSILNN
jgi:hypothetical protein